MNRPSPLQDFAEATRAAPALWRLIGALGVIFGALLLLGLGVGAAGLALGVDIGGYIRGFETPLSAFLILATFLVWRPTIWLALRLFRLQPYRRLFGPTGRVEGARFLAGLGGAVCFTLFSTGIAAALVGPPQWTGAAAAPWLGLALLALPLIYIQSSAEEILFRGLILQHMAARFGAFWAWGLIPSVLFGLLHWNPDGYGPAAMMVLAITGLTGLVFALVTAATGDLGSAMGLHIGLNVFALLLIAPNEAFAGLALAHWPDDEVSLNRLLMIDLSALAIACVAAALFYRRRMRRSQAL